MKTKFFTFCVALACATNVLAYDFEVDGIYYNKLGGDSVAVTFKTLYTDCYPSTRTDYSGSVVIPSSVNYGNSYRVTSIGDSAFYNCGGLTSVTIPESVTSIGRDAFSGCSGLTSVTIPESVTSIGNNVFRNCTSLKSVQWNAINYNRVDFGNQVENFTFGNAVKVIPANLCKGMNKLTSVTIPESVTSIGDSVFYDCTGLKSIQWNATNCNQGGESVFGNQVENFTFGSAVKVIPANLCKGMNKLTSVTIPESVTSIGDNAFSDCSSLDTVTLNSNAVVSKTYTSSSSLKDKFGTQVTTYILGDSVTNIGEHAFSSCSDLNSVTIPNSVTSIGSFAFSGCTNLVSITLNSNSIAGKTYTYNYNIEDIFGAQVNEYILGENVTSIGTYAFYKCKNLTSVTIPASVTSIERLAFSECSGLTSVIIPATNIKNYAFYNCNSLASVTILNGVINIGDSVFFNCGGLTSVTIPESVISIGWYAFLGCYIESVQWNAKNCNSCYFGNQVENFTLGSTVKVIPRGLCQNMNRLTSVNIPDSVTSIGDNAFYNCTGLTSMTIPNSVTTIGSNAFKGCSGLTSVTIPESVTSIGDGAFYYCRGLNSMTIPSSVANLGVDAFSNCSSLTTVTLNSNAVVSKTYTSSSSLKDRFGTQVTTYILGDSVTNIGEYAFSSCSDLTSVTIPNSVTNIGNYAFYNCTGLTSATIPSSITSIGSSAFSGCSGLNSVTIPNSVTSIGDYAFYNCTGLTSVTIPASNSITSIGDYAFQGCTPIAGELTLPRIKTLGAYAFDGCSKITSVDLGSSLEEVGNYAFNQCNHIYDITCLAKNPPLVEENAFYNYNAYLHVPCSSLRYYSVDGVWGKFANVECVSAESSTTGEFAVTPAETDATFAWPMASEADSYTLEITKDGEVFCTLEFNANGQLNSIAFAPSANGTNAPASTGFQFKVIGLNSASKYSYVFTADDATDSEVYKYEGNFYTTGYSGKYTLSVNADATMGKATGAGEFYKDEVATIEAIANDGYEFVAWNDGVKDNPRTITITGDITYSAVFQEITALEVISIDGLRVENGRIICGGDFRIYDMLGRDVTRLNGNLQGVYVVKVGSKTQKVVVN